MIPLRDNIPSRSVPFVNVTLIAINVLFFILELSLGENLQGFLLQASVVPVLYTGPDRTLGPLEALLTTLDPTLGSRVFISMFLHGGWAHIIGNMLYLWIFGDNIEDRLGHARYVFFYFACGWAATYAHIWADPASRLPSIGASGAIAGVLGAYLMLYPHARVVTLLPLGIVAPLIRVPAIFFLGFWFVQQFLYGALTLSARTSQQTGGVAWWAHIGGFLAGAALVWLLQKPGRRPPARDRWWDH